MSETKMTQFTYQDKSGNTYILETGGSTIYTVSLASGAYGTIIGGTKIMEGGTQEVIIKKPSDTSSYLYILPDDATSITCTNSTLVKVDTSLINEDYFALHVTAPSNNVVLNPGIMRILNVNKGNIIKMNLGNTATPTWGTLHQYRVLKREGSKALVMSMYTPTNSTFGSSQTYNGSTLDTYCNTTWYNTLSDEAKAAIVDQTISQYKYSSGSTSTSHMSYATYSSKTLVGSMTRHCYALDVEDIEEYFGGTAGSASATTQGTFTKEQLLTMFFNQTSTLSYFVWLRSASSSGSSSCWYVYGGNGYVNYDSCTDSYGVRVAFVIDLSKISYEIVS